MNGVWRGAGVGAALVLALAWSQEPRAEPEPRLSTASLVDADCHLCHAVPLAEPAPRIQSCNTCHVWIRAVASDPTRRAKAMAVFPHWERYEKSVASYLEVPSLDAAMARLDPAWVAAYLADPHDLRPSLPESMPRFGLDAEKIATISQVFASRRALVPPTPPPDPSRIAEGERVFASKGCVACHAFGARHAVAGVPMAPDLAHTRARMGADHVAAWIADPKALSGEATMPDLGLTDAEVLAVRDYVLLAEADAPAAPALGALPPPTKRPVAWAEVEERVFGRICQHCHMNPELNDGRAGPGNDGGFGWAPTGIELQTYEGVVAAAPRIPDALARRRAEAHRDVVSPGFSPSRSTRPEKAGMPLGLPPLSDEDTSLVLGWIEQGTPR